MATICTQGDLHKKVTEVIFSNSLIIQQVITKEIITVTVVWKSDLNIISIDFNNFISSLLLNFSFDREAISQNLVLENKTVGLVLSSVFSCLETPVKHLHSFLKYYIKSFERIITE